MPKPWGIDFGKKSAPGEIVLPQGRLYRQITNISMLTFRAIRVPERLDHRRNELLASAARAVRMPYIKHSLGQKSAPGEIVLPRGRLYRQITNISMLTYRANCVPERLDHRRN